MGLVDSGLEVVFVIAWQEVVRMEEQLVVDVVASLSLHSLAPP